YYAPNNATLVVVGDFRPVELRRLVNQYFADIPSQPPPPAVSCQYRLAPGLARRDVEDEHANLAAAFRIYRLPPHTDPDIPTIERGTGCGRAEALEHYSLFHGSVAEINSDLDRYLAVSAADVQRVATKYLDPANGVIVIVRPKAAVADSGATK